MKIRDYYLCDGNVEDCNKDECYKFGGECMHTQNIENAINPQEKRIMVKNPMGDNWEIEN